MDSKRPITCNCKWIVLEKPAENINKRVLVAFQEVEDSLSNIEFYGKQYDVAVETLAMGTKNLPALYRSLSLRSDLLH